MSHSFETFSILRSIDCDVGHYTRLERGAIAGASESVLDAMRREAGRDALDERLAELIGELSTLSPLFQEGGTPTLLAVSDSLPAVLGGVLVLGDRAGCP